MEIADLSIVIKKIIMKELKEEIYGKIVKILLRGKSHEGIALLSGDVIKVLEEVIAELREMCVD